MGKNMNDPLRVLDADFGAYAEAVLDLAARQASQAEVFVGGAFRQITAAGGRKGWKNRPGKCLLISGGLVDIVCSRPTCDMSVQTAYTCRIEKVDRAVSGRTAGPGSASLWPRMP